MRKRHFKKIVMYWSADGSVETQHRIIKTKKRKSPPRMGKRYMQLKIKDMIKVENLGKKLYKEKVVLYYRWPEVQV